MYINYDGFYVEITYTYNDYERTRSFSGNFCIIDENSTIMSVQRRQIVTAELTEESILYGLRYAISDDVQILDSLGNYFYFNSDEYVNKLELLSDLSGLDYGTHNMEFSFYGAKVTYDINYITLDDYYIYASYHNEYILNTATTEEEFEQLLVDNIKLYVYIQGYDFIYGYHYSYEYELPNTMKYEILVQNNAEYFVENYENCIFDLK